MNIIELLKMNSKRVPDKVALVHKKTKVSYRELNDRSENVGRFFVDQGVYPGQKALLLIPLSIDLYVIYLGLIRIGVTVVLIDTSAGRDYVEACVKSVSPEIFIATPKAHLLRMIGVIGRIGKKFSTTWLPGSKVIRYLYDKDKQYLDTEKGEKFRDFDAGFDHPALITFTSGSTGTAKGISRSHGFLVNQHRTISRTLMPKDSDIELNTLPIFTLSNLASGITTVITDTIASHSSTSATRDIVKQVQQENVVQILAAPAFYQNIVDYLETEKKTMDSIKRIYIGGGPIFPNLLKKIFSKFPKAQVIAVYGSTEAEPIAHICMNSVSQKMREKMQKGDGLLAGKPITDITLAIIPDMGQQQIGPFTHDEFSKFSLSAMSHGEIVVTGDHVQKAYISGDEKKEKFKVGRTIWHRTGDAGYLDRQGYLWLSGRCCAKIIRGDRTIYPFGLEAAAMSFAEVRRAAFLELNEITAMVIETDTKDARSLCQKIKLCLKDIDTIHVVKKIPLDKRHHSKIAYARLKKMLLEL